MHPNLQLSSLIPPSLAVEHVMPIDGVFLIRAKSVSLPPLARSGRLRRVASTVATSILSRTCRARGAAFGFTSSPAGKERPPPSLKLGV